MTPYSKWAKPVSYLSLLMFSLLSSIRDVGAKHLFHSLNVNPVFFTWLCCLITFLFFYGILVARTRKIYLGEDVITAGLDTRMYLAWINIGTLIAFVTTFMAIRLIDPYANSLIDYGATPLVTVALAILIRRERISLAAWVGIGVSVMGIAILIRALQPASNHEGYPGWKEGIVLAAISCIAAALNGVFSKQLVDRGIRRDRLMVLRMPGILAGLGLWIIFGRIYPPETMNLVPISVLAIGGFALPLFLVVFAFEHLEVKHLSFAIFLIPVFTFIASLVARTLLGWDELLLYGSLSLSMIAGIIVLIGVIWSERFS